MSRLTDSQMRRFFDRVDTVTESGCWIWMGATSPKGYGKFHVPGKSTMAHRIAYEQFKEPVPAGLFIDHLCRVRCCVNPDHMQICSNQENVLSGDGITAKNAQKTHCPQGHAYTRENTRYYKGRNCRACHRIRKRIERGSDKMSAV